MSGIHDTLYGPLGKEYCMYFFAMMVINSTLAVICALLTLGAILGSKRFSFGMGPTNAFFATLSFSISYFVMRLFYTMCIR